jgi:hypothetical protein
MECNVTHQQFVEVGSHALFSLPLSSFCIKKAHGRSTATHQMAVMAKSEGFTVNQWLARTEKIRFGRHDQISDDVKQVRAPCRLAPSRESVDRFASALALTMRKLTTFQMDGWEEVLRKYYPAKGAPDDSAAHELQSLAQQEAEDSEDEYLDDF